MMNTLTLNKLIESKNIIRSMSRAGKPTDNPVNESLNGWIKEELFIDFNLGKYETKEQIVLAIEKYIKYYNSGRPCYSLGYDTPDNFYRRFIAGEIERKNTFEDRELSEIPKFVRMARGNLI